MRISPKNPIKGQTNNRGFTLVEFLVSLTLVTLLLTGTVQLTIYSLLVKRNADLNLKITEHASSLFEHFKSFPYESEHQRNTLKKRFDWFCIYPESLVSDMIKITAITEMIICIDSSENFTCSSL
jgi:prepilin-type N-terminal cleavage/methylation domain-containing protein